MSAQFADHAVARRSERAALRRLWFTIALDVQILIGLYLYFVLSPFTTAAFNDFGAAMRTPPLRFWAVEHAFGMLLCAVVAHVGRMRLRKAEPARRHMIAAIFFGIALVVLLASIPWPGTPNGRPWIRF